ncbi:MAG: aldo/keto reductase [Candidatus Thorarchaeota archaeon]
MEYRYHRNLKISEVGVGCYALSGAYGSVDSKQFQQMITHAFELGVNFFDTAEGYGEAEKILGESIKPFREEVLVATKVGIREGVKPNLSETYVLEACQLSLEHLQTDYIDLYQVHFDDPATPVKETVSALDSLVDEGKIRHYGVGHLPKNRVQEYCQIGEPFSILMELSAVARKSREDLLPLCGSQQVAAIGFSTTGRGILTGKYGLETKFEPNDIRNMDPLFQRARFQSALVVKDKFTDLARDYNKTPVQVAIAWVLAQPNVICALTGSSKIKHLEENIGGSGWTISKKDLEQLDQFFVYEDRVLAEEEQALIRRILSEPLSMPPTQAFIDLIYVLETSHDLGLLSEQQVRQVFQKLWPIHKSLDESSKKKLTSIQRELQTLID